MTSASWGASVNLRCVFNFGPYAVLKLATLTLIHSLNPNKVLRKCTATSLMFSQAACFKELVSSLRHQQAAELVALSA